MCAEHKLNILYCSQLHECISYLATWDLNSRRLKISARVLAFNWFLADVWQSLDKCLSRYWSVSQYCWGILGDLMSLFSTWAYSSAFCPSAKKSVYPNKSGIIQPSLNWAALQIHVVNPNFFFFFWKSKILRDLMGVEKTNYTKLKLKQKTHLVKSHKTFNMCLTFV